MDQAVALQEAQVGQCQVAAVEQLDFHFFIGRDVVGELHTDLFPRWAPGYEFVFHHPLQERLAHHWPGILDAVALEQLLAVVAAGHWRDAVDHSVGEAHVLTYPAGQVRVEQLGEGQQGLARDRTIVRQVVAGHHRERPHAGFAAPPQRFAEKAEHALRGLRVGQIVPDLRQVSAKLAGAVVDAVAAFGDGQRDDADAGLGQFGQQRLGIVLGQEHVIEGTDHPHFGVGSVVQHKQGVQVALRRQGVAHGAVFAAQAGAADGPVQAFAAVHQGVGVGRLMGTVKPTYTNVHDALAQLRGRVGRAGDRGRQQVEVVRVEFHRVCPQAACCRRLSKAWPLLSNRWQWPGSKVSSRGSPKAGAKSPRTRTVSISPEPARTWQ